MVIFVYSMKRIYTLFSFLLLLLSKISLGQYEGLIPSNAYIQTCIDKSQCFAINSSAFLFYDETKQAFFLKLDLNKFKTGEDTLDDWLDDLGGDFLYMKAPLEKENFVGGLANNNSKTFDINAQVLLNHVWDDESIELNVSQAEPSSLNPNLGNSIYANKRVTFALVLSPKDYKVHKGSHNVKKTIYIGIHSGQINFVKDNMYLLLGEAYDRQ